VARAILAGQLPQTRELKVGGAAVAGVYPDGWTRGSEPAGVALANRQEEGSLVYELIVGCHAGEGDLPMDMLLYDGEREVEITFERPGEQTVIFDPVEAGEARLVVVTSRGSWSPGGGDERDLGVILERVEISLRGTLEALQRKDDAEARSWCHMRIMDGDTPGQLNLLDDTAEAVGLTGDGWTTAEEPAAMALSNGRDEDLVLDIKLECHAAPEDLPITAYLDDGMERREVRFMEKGLRTVTLDPIPAGDTRLMLVSTDATWSPGTEADQRQLGVRIDVEE